MVFRNLSAISRGQMLCSNCESHLVNELVRSRGCYSLRGLSDLPLNGSAGAANESIAREKAGKRGDENHSRSNSVTVDEISREIHLYRDANNNFKEATYVDVDAPYGPPLTILLPSLLCDASDVRKFVELYASRGFDVISVRLSKNQILYPMKDDGAIKVVSNFLGYLHGSHRYRPYLVHGLSTGAYVYGEMMAQLTEQFGTYSTLVGNIKGCLWDSPVDYAVPAQVAAKALYPRNFVKRWFFGRAVARHFADRKRDSVDCWKRSRAYFCQQKCKVPNLFFVSEGDPLSNPETVEPVRNLMEKNGIPTYQKTWPGAEHLGHFENNFDEYVCGIKLFLSLSNMFADPGGKFRSYDSNSRLTWMRLRKRADEASRRA